MNPTNEIVYLRGQINYLHRELFALIQSKVETKQLEPKLIPGDWHPYPIESHFGIQSTASGIVYLKIPTYDKAVRLCNVLNEP